ncbi:MAG: glycoside hydrolase family 140 protein [Caldilineaceae bacterium]|nr:glycoside hydrolase family 140 protein [Caldilineaceae bacterium]
MKVFGSGVFIFMVGLGVIMITAAYISPTTHKAARHQTIAPSPVYLPLIAVAQSTSAPIKTPVPTTTATSTTATSTTATSTTVATLTPTLTPSPAASATPTPTANGPAFPLKLAIDAQARYLVDQNNQPVLINGDTPWSLIGQVSKEDAELYLQDTAQRGFNSIVVTLVESHYVDKAPFNYDGDDPYLEYQNGAPKFDTPNEAYFAHADWVIHKAGEYGLQVILAPNYLGCCADGYYGALSADVNSLSVVQAYGTFIGNRYKDVPNLMYVWGNDVNPCGVGSAETGCEVSQKIDAMAAAVKAADPNHLHTYHSSPEFSAADIKAAHNYDWIDVNTTYTYSPVQERVLQDYNRAPLLPFFLFESHYEQDWNNASALQTRKEAYVAILAGASGNHYGNNPIWHMNSISLNGINDSWKNHLDDEGRADMIHVKHLFESRNWPALIPDQNHTVLISGFESGSDYAAAARVADGASVIVYTPSQRALTLDMSQIAGSQARAWWYDPREGLSQNLGTFANAGTRLFTPPTSEDWILVIDNADLNLPAPGS